MQKKKKKKEKEKKSNFVRDFVTYYSYMVLITILQFLENW